MISAALSLAGILLLLAAGLGAMMRLHNRSKWVKIGPAALCTGCVFWAADRLSYLSGEAVTATQLPIKGYIPTLVFIGCALTLFGLLRHGSHHQK